MKFTYTKPSGEKIDLSPRDVIDIGRTMALIEGYPFPMTFRNETGVIQFVLHENGEWSLAVPDADTAVELRDYFQGGKHANG